MTTISELLNDMGSKLEGAWILAISDFDGMMIASWQSRDNKLNPELLSGQFVRMLRSLDSITSDIASDLPTEVSMPIKGNPFILEDVVITTNFSHVLIKPMCKNTCYLLVDSSKKTPLGLVRMAASSYVPKLEQCLPG